MRKFYLKTPMSMDEIRELEVGDVVYLSGTVHTARDEAHRKILDMLKEDDRKSKICELENRRFSNEELPFDLNEGVIYHCGPIVLREVSDEEKRWRIISAGPTTSSRMNDLAPKIIEKYEIRAIIGKGGMGEKVREKLFQRGVYLAYTGGAALLAASKIKEVLNVYWEDLGMAEAVWELEVRDFGPLIVTMDSHKKVFCRGG
jgi:hydro-lyases, Fe-S type, tartrate/fumarate subfamily, beta region